MEEKMTYISYMLDILNNDPDSSYSKKYLEEHNLDYKNIMELKSLVVSDESEVAIKLLNLMVDKLADSMIIGEFLRGGFGVVVGVCKNKQGEGE